MIFSLSTSDSSSISSFSCFAGILASSGAQGLFRPFAWGLFASPLMLAKKYSERWCPKAPLKYPARRAYGSNGAGRPVDTGRRSRLSRHDQQPHQFAASSMDGCVDNQDYNDGAQDDHPIGQFNACYRCPFAKPFHDYPLPIFKQRLTKAKSRRVQGLFCLSFFTGDGQTRQCVGLTLIHLLVSDREPSADDATNSHFTAHGL